jgi:hypothetical protein
LQSQYLFWLHSAWHNNLVNGGIAVYWLIIYFCAFFGLSPLIFVISGFSIIYRLISFLPSFARSDQARQNSKTKPESQLSCFRHPLTFPPSHLPTFSTAIFSLLSAIRTYALLSLRSALCALRLIPFAFDLSPLPFILKAARPLLKCNAPRIPLEAGCSLSAALRLPAARRPCFNILIIIPVILMLFLIAPCAHSAQVTLAWDSNKEPNVSGYMIYYGKVSRNYTHIVDPGNDTQHTIADLDDGARYYFAVTALNEDGFESDYSEELAWSSGSINHSPATPSAPEGPSSGYPQSGYAFSTTTTDPDGDTLKYRFDWGDGTFSDWGLASESHSWTSSGDFCVKSQAKDDQGASSNWSVCHNISIKLKNQPPIAEAGSDQNVSQGVVVRLNGSGSNDPDDHIATWSWSQTSGTAVTLSDPYSSETIFVSPYLGAEGESLTFVLTVEDTQGQQSQDTCTVTVAGTMISDSDNDGISDNDETNIYGTDPNKSDTDGDGISDGDELALWGKDWDADFDGDGLVNLLDSDSNNDGIKDSEEIQLGNNSADSAYAIIPYSQLSIVSYDSEELKGENGAAANSIDGDTSMIWHTEWLDSNPAHPHEIVIDLADDFPVGGFRYLPRQDGDINGTVADYAFYVSKDGFSWGEPVAKGTFPNNVKEKEVMFSSKVGRYVRFVALSEVNGQPWTSMAEISIVAAARLDTDDDGISDIDEIDYYGTDPENPDSDGDGINDGEELTFWGNNWSADQDGDGLINILDPDSDDDEVSDGIEINQGTSPINQLSTPASEVVFAVNTGGAEYVDENGILYQTDTLYYGGKTYKSSASISDTNDDTLYQSERYGNFSYDIPLASGNYLVTLKFAEIYWNKDGRRIFDVEIEGNEVISNFDIFTQVGQYSAYDVALPVSVLDGILNIDFYTIKDKAKVSAIKVETTNMDNSSIIANKISEVVFAVNTGGTEYVDENGILYQTDTLYYGGKTYKSSTSISDTNDDTLYQSERYGNFSYDIPLANGNYLVTLKFAEIFWNDDGRRIFNVEMEGNEVISNFDIFTQVGQYSAYHVALPVSVLDGILNIDFYTIKDNAKVSAITVTAD